MYNSVLNTFLAAFGAPLPQPVLTPQIEAARNELLCFVAKKLEAAGHAMHLYCDALELQYVSSDLEEAGREIAGLLEERDLPLLWLERQSWGYGFVARGSGQSFALGGVVLETPRNVSWFATCELRRVD
ncbi:MAG: hypothetical protein HC933_08335 [Pleurocapsa sp. SU_196_0]|nr:hypothetical protein [Pleurocapsa sp. SU_196_0]